MCLLFWTHSVHCQKGQGPSVLPTMKYMAPEGMIGVRPGTVDSSLKQISALACMRKEEEEEEEEGIVNIITSFVSSTHTPNPAQLVQHRSLI